MERQSNSESQKPSSLLGKSPRETRLRAFILFSVITFLAAVIVGRLVYLQIIRHADYQRLVLEQMIYETSVTAKRGKITDRNGILLASNYTTERVFIDPHVMQNDEERALVSQGLSEILDVEYDFIYTESQKINYRDRTIKQKVEKETADKVRQFIIDHDLKSIHLVETTNRIYPFGTLASHVLGFCGADGGLYGLEYYYNNSLSGVSGKILSAKNGSGKEMPYNYETYIDAQNGANLVTTIDYKIQSYLEKYLEEAAVESGCQSRACGIVMDPNTGEILAMATYPSFDLNSPYTLSSYYDTMLSSYAAQVGEDSDEYKKYASALLLSGWNNKCLTDTYEPGSTSKIFTTSIALEEDKVSLTETFYCTGSYKVKGWSKPIKCHKTTGHGQLTFAGGLQQSCNPVMMQLAERIGIHTYCQYFAAFGLSSKTGIDLPGEASPIYAKEDVMTNVDLAVYSFGQRYNVTALNQIAAVAAVANGGTLVTPHVVKEIVDDEGNVLASFGTTEVRQVISKETASTITQILADGVAGDGGAKNARVNGYSVAAKTGTSEKGVSGARIASTVAYAPADNPQVACIIIVDEPTIGSIYGSTVAAPYVSKLLADILPYLGIKPTYTAEELAKMEMSLPNFRGMSLDEAVSRLSVAHLSYEIIGDGTSVVSQVPPSGSKMSADDGKVLLYTESDTEEQTSLVPSVIGKSAAEANRLLTGAGFNIHLDGTVDSADAVAISQSITAGTVAPRGSVITVVFRYIGADD